MLSTSVTLGSIDFLRSYTQTGLFMSGMSFVPDKLQYIPDPPRQLFTVGVALEHLLDKPCLTVVGSRRVSAYGKAVTTQLVTQAARAGAVIISGLALGVDSIAHRAALEAGGPTIAVMPAGLDKIYPASHANLAKQIIQQGGALVSEYPPGTPPYKYNFVERNRLASGLSDAVLITEAGEKSGTLHTAQFALEQGKEVLAVPGNITSPTSVGANNLIKAGATPVTCIADLLRALGLSQTKQSRAPQGSTPEEQMILDLIFAGTADGSDLLAKSQLEVSIFNQSLTMLEITGKVQALGNNQWALQ
ncbi:MAG TPA: DNA-processing protein DprA [Candidatus Saccharimonadales bacterium]